MQNNIFNFALKCGEINRVVLCEMCDQMEDGMRQRFVEAVLGIVNPDDVVSGIPVIQDVDGHKDCRRISFNYLLDEVQYEYDEVKTYFFDDEKKAKTFEEDGSWGYYGNNKPDETHTIEATHTFTHSGCTNIQYWMRGDGDNKKGRK